MQLREQYTKEQKGTSKGTVLKSVPPTHLYSIFLHQRAQPTDVIGVGAMGSGGIPHPAHYNPLSPLSTHLQVVGVGQSPSPHLRHPTQLKGGCGTASPTTPR